MGWNIDSLFDELSELEGKVTALEKVLKTENANSEELLCRSNLFMENEDVLVVKWLSVYHCKQQVRKGGIPIPNTVYYKVHKKSPPLS